MQHYFLSPHLDDVALSCGGLVKRLVDQGQQVDIVTVCTADWPADRPLTPAIKKEHDQWQLGDWPYRARRLEDQAATKVLGAAALHLNLPDAIYRFDAQGRPLYAKDFIGVLPHPDDWKQQAIALAGKLGEIILDGSDIYCPLAIGRHVDHTIVRQVAEVLFSKERIIYYEDYPYADQIEARRTETESFANPRTTQVGLSEDELNARLHAIACYDSQVQVMFGGTAAMVNRVRAYVGETAIERYWHDN